jgi:hypothetical protein
MGWGESLYLVRISGHDCAIDLHIACVGSLGGNTDETAYEIGVHLPVRVIGAYCAPCGEIIVY